MSCCCPHSKSAGRLFSFFARRYRRRFEKKGFEPSQKQLMEGLWQAGYQNSMVLEVGSGVGHLHQTLLEQGASFAVGIDLAADMINEAKQWADDRDLTDRTQYLEGDFIELLDQIKNADVCVMDKVVCCYPDADGLVKATLAKTRRVYALTYPRNIWYVRFAIGLGALLMKLIRSDFRPYVHNPVQVEQWVVDKGFNKQYERQTFIWLTQVFTKS